MSDALRDPRAYLQTRVAVFSKVSCGFFSLLMAADFMTPAEGERLLSSTRLASLSMVTTSAVIWAYVRQGERSAWVCRTLELAAMAVGMAGFATLPMFPPLPGAGGIMSMITPTLMAVLVMLRAAVIPSPAWLSVAVGLIWGSVMSVSSSIGWEGITIAPLPGQDVYADWAVPLILGFITTVSFSIVAGVISHVVHGLQTQVREAMQYGQYTLESKIGEGGMGAVYRARHRMLRRPTAVKLLPPDKAGEAAIERFEREVQHTSRLTHPNTVAIFDFGRTQDGIFYYAMEYLDGISLEDLVDMVGPLPPERAIHILLQVAEALTEAHDMGLVHRDIKPDNVILCERGGVADIVKVLDFGLVKDVQTPSDTKLSSTETIQGTPLYMAPESVKDPESVDARTDLYALGGVAYFLLAGEPVFGGNIVEVFGHHLHTQPPPLPRSVGKELDAVVMRCLDKDPDDRFQSAADMALALRACPDADNWTRARAHAWWDAERANIESRRSSEHEPSNLTLAPA